MSFVRVALDVPIDELFDYGVLPAQTAQPGQRVIVPFGRGRRAGVVMALSAQSSLPGERVKKIESVCVDEPPVPGDLLDLARFCADYYQHPLGQVMMMALPPRLREARAAPVQRDRRLGLTDAGRRALMELPARQKRIRQLLEVLAEREGLTEAELRDAAPEARHWVVPLVERQWIRYDATDAPTAAKATVTQVPVAQAPVAQAVAIQAPAAQGLKAQAPAIQPSTAQAHTPLTLHTVPETSTAPATHTSHSALTPLSDLASPAFTSPSDGGRQPAFALSMHQQEAVDSVAAALGREAVFLLLGVTGSGKTAVYLELIARAIAAGRQVLMLVPEINLTPQLEARVRERFPDVVLVSLHSDLAEGERLTRWRAALDGSARIIMGTRLAVFTPVRDLGLIIVDEEHDESFKQEEGLRYHARDLAVWRGRQRGVPVLLGSATPALESYAHAQAGRYRLLHLPERVAAQPPQVRCIDTRNLKMNEGLSGPLLEAIERTLARGEQSLIFINRRGYSPALLCYACGWIAQCARCEARLVFHSRQAQLRCHHCGHAEAVPMDCPGCGNADLRPRGHGTQRLEAELARVFPAARLARVDRDTTQRRHAFADLRERVHDQSLDILVGTQMLTKGHDFPNLTLVGVVNPDAVLFSTDFRASERLFALLMQVSGRAGRAQRPGQVLIQTDFPQHPIYAAVEQQNYEPFARELLEERRAMTFPPYCHQALLRAEAGQRSHVDAFLRAAADLCQSSEGLEVFDPVPAGVARVAGRERGQLLLQSASRTRLRAWLTQWRKQLAALEGARRVRWHIDVDPRAI